MKANLFFLILVSFNSQFLFAQTAKYEYKIIDSLFIGIPVEDVAWDSNDTMWFVNKSNNLYKSFGDSLWVYNSSNSNLTSKEINEIAIDSKDTIWLITEKGLVKLDHNSFITYDTTNSNIPPYWYHELVIDKDDNIWFSSSVHMQGGLIKFDKKDWHVYTPDNSLLPSNFIYTIVVDTTNNIWLASEGAINEYSVNSDYSPVIIKIDNSEWTVFNETNIGIPLNFFMKSLLIDHENNLIIKISYAASSSSNIGKPSLVRYDGIIWEIIDTVSILGDWPWAYGTDINNNIWTIDLFRNLNYYDGHLMNYLGKFYHSTYDIKEGIDGFIWLLTSNGIYVLDTDIPDIANSISKPEEINIFPNPTPGIFNIDMDGFDECEVYNMMGVHLLTTKNKNIDVSQFTPGIYVLKIKAEHGKQYLKKVIIKK